MSFVSRIKRTEKLQISQQYLLLVICLILVLSTVLTACERSVSTVDSGTVTSYTVLTNPSLISTPTTYTSSKSTSTTDKTTTVTTKTATASLPNLIIIAAADSNNQWKSQAAVVCSGESDQSLINKYLITGHVIELAAGTFTCDGIIYMQANTHVFGQGDTTIINCNGGGIYVHDIDNVELDHFKITGAINQGIILASIYIDATTNDHSGFSIHDIKESAKGGFLIYANGYRLTNVVFANCDSSHPDGMGFFMDGDGIGSIMQDFIFYNCTVEDAGIANTRFNDWVTGFDFAEGDNNLTVNRLSVIKCSVNGAWESDFHFEAAPKETGIVILDCNAINAGQKASPTYGYGYLLPSSPSSEYIFQGNTGGHNLGSGDVYDAQDPYVHNLAYNIVYGSLKKVSRIFQANCEGLIVTSGNDKDLYLYSNDSNPVAQPIELGGFYTSNNGETYTFDGTKIVVEFKGYAVIHLTKLP
jgi:hypothetical protein